MFSLLIDMPLKKEKRNNELDRFGSHFYKIINDKKVKSCYSLRS